MRRNFTKRLGGLALLTVVAAVAVAPATALAQDALSNPSDAQYQPQSQVHEAVPAPRGRNGGGNGGNNQSSPVASNTAASTPTSGLNSNVGSLPFTGMDVIVLALVAAGLLGTGLALRRLSSPKVPGA